MRQAVWHCDMLQLVGLIIACLDSFAAALDSDHLARIVKSRALSGCCMATNLVACLVFSIAWELIPLGEGGVVPTLQQPCLV